MITNAQSKAISYAQVIFFAIISIPILCATIRHGRKGLLGWIPLCGFCVVRILGGVFTIHDLATKGHISTLTAILASLGINPLLSAAEGIIHEARGARGIRWRGWIEWGVVIGFHVAATVGAVLIVTRGDDLSNPHRSSNSQHLLDIALIIFFLVWLGIGLWVAISYFQRPSSITSFNTQEFDGGSKLLLASAITLPITGVRVIYALVFFIANSVSFQESLVVRIIMDVAPEMLFTLIVALVGLVTRDMYSFKHKKLDRQLSMEPYSHGYVNA